MIATSAESSLARLPAQLNEAKSALKNMISSAQTLSNAFKEQSENGTLSLNTIMAIVDSGFAAALDTSTESVKLNAEAFKELAKARLIDAKATAVQKRNSIQLQLQRERESLESTIRFLKSIYLDSLAEGFKRRLGI